MSQLCNQVIQTVRELFPEVLVKTEEFVYFRNQKLFLDIFLPQLGIVIEVHGRQHDEFVEHFHGDAEGYKQSRRRDRWKEEWAAETGHTWVVLRKKDLPITPERLLELIDVAGNI